MTALEKKDENVRVIDTGVSVFHLLCQGCQVIQRGLVPTIFFLALLLAVARPVYAHGADGTQEVDGVPVGPFTLTVWSFPGTLRVGEVHLSAAVLRPSDGMPVVNCTVIFQLSPLDEKGKIQDGVGLVAEAGSANATTGFMHEAFLKLEMSGSYRVDVRVINASGELDGVATFDVMVRRVSILFKWLVIGLGLLTTATVVWFIYEGRLVWAHRNLIGKEMGVA